MCGDNYETELTTDVICKDASQQDTLDIVHPGSLFEIKTIHEAHETKLVLFARFGVISWIVLLVTGTKHETKLSRSSSEMA